MKQTLKRSINNFAVCDLLRKNKISFFPKF